MNKKGFTLIEVVIALSVFSFVIVGIVFALNRAFSYVEHSKLQAMAVNLAREGVEIVYNIRDTNRRKNSGEKDRYRLLSDPFNTSSPLFGGIDAYYVFTEKTTSAGIQYYTLQKKTTLNDKQYESITHFTDQQKTDYLISFTGSVYSGITETKISDLMENEAKFYRVLKVYGVYNKLATGPNVVFACSSAGDCNNANPKELRFCVKVFYASTVAGSIELCSMITNFRE